MNILGIGAAMAGFVIGFKVFVMDEGLIYCTKKNQITLAKIFIFLGANLNYLNTQGVSALTLAARNGRLEIAKALISSGARVDQPDCYGRRAIFYAARNSYTEIVRSLIDKGADVHSLGNQVGPMMRAFQRGHHDIVDLLHAQGATLFEFRPRLPGLPALAGAAQAPGITTREEKVRASLKNPVNNKQSTHVEVVHQSISESIAKLKKYYEDKLVNLKEKVQELKNWLDNLPDNYSDIKVQAAKRAVSTILKTKFVEPRSQVNLEETLALVWTGVCDKQAQNDTELSEADIQQRQKTWICHLYECQRGNNLDSEGKDDNASKDRVICSTGIFNKLVSTLAGGHSQVSIHFVNAQSMSLKAHALCKSLFLGLPEAIQSEFRSQWTSERGMPAGLWEAHLKIPLEAKLHEEFDSVRTLVGNYDIILAESLETIKNYMELPVNPLIRQPLLNLNNNK